MLLEIISSETRMKSIIPEWSLLASSSFISMDPSWLVNWWDCYKNDCLELHLYAVWESADLKALMPLMMEKRSNKTNVLRFLSNNCSDYLGIVTTSDCNAQDYIDLIASQLTNDSCWDSIILDNLSSQDETICYLAKKLTENNFILNIVKHDDIGRMEIVQPWYKFIKTKSANTRHAYSKLLKNERYFGFRVLFDYDQKVIEQLCSIHESRWENANYSSTFSDERRRKFIHRISKDFSNKGELVIFLLLNNETIVSYRYGFIRNDVYYDWNTSFDIRYEQLSCGKILIKRIYEYCFENGIKMYDFMKGLETYKKQLITTSDFLFSIECKSNKNNIQYTPQKSKIITLLNNTKGVIFDLDGVVYSGSQPISDTIEAIRLLQKKKIKIGFLTNTSSKTINEIKQKLELFGVNTIGCYFMTSSIATGKYLYDIGCCDCVVFGGGESLLSEISNYNIHIISKNEITENKLIPSAVVIGYTTHFSYDDLLFCADLVEKGSTLVCTDKDNRFAYNGGWLPGTGWIISSIEWITSKPAIVVGKPKEISLKYLVKDMHENANQLLMVGDNLDTDILAAKSINMPSCLLLGGVSQKEDVARLSNYNRPDMVVDSLMKIEKNFRRIES